MESVSISASWKEICAITLGAVLLLVSCPDKAAAALRQSAPVPSQNSAAESLKSKALEEGESGKIDDAIRDYKQALQVDPSWKEGWWNLGVLQYGANHFADASLIFKRVVQFAPDLGNAWALLGLSEYETRDYANSLTHLERARSLAIRDDPEIERVAIYHLGLLLVQSSAFERALSLLLSQSASGAISPQLAFAAGMATLRIPLFPNQVDPSQEALVQATGDAVTDQQQKLSRLAALLKDYPDVPYLHYGYGIALADAGKDTDALLAFQQETAISPTSPLPWIASSRIALRTGDMNSALQFAQKAVGLAPQSSEAHETLAKVFDAQGKEQASSEHQSATHLPDTPVVEKRILLRYSATNSDGTRVEESWNQALQEYSTGNYPAAAENLKKWLQANPGNGTGWAMLGLCEFGLKDFDNALIHLDRGAKLGLAGSPESLQIARYTYGALLVRSGQFEQASEVLAAAAVGGALEEKIEYELGLALLRRTEFPNTDKKSDHALITAAGKIAVLLHQSKYDEAIAGFKQLLVSYPSEPFLHYAYGTALLALSEFDEATIQMRAECSISPGSELPLIRLASISLRQHNASDAIVWSQRALSLAPNSANAHYLLGRALMDSGDTIRAVHELEIAASLSPASPEIHFNLAKAYTQAKMPEKARRERAIFSQTDAAANANKVDQDRQIYFGPRRVEDITGQPTSHPQPK
jgi:tetratricopeptide (TPR) repeat protein